MATFWGLDWHEVQLSKLKASHMFKNRDYYLRRTKFVTYQLVTLFWAISQAIGTRVLQDYVGQQSHLQRLFPDIYVANNNYVGVASYHIFVVVITTGLFGAALFFDLFWPLRYEPRWVQWLWQGMAVFVSAAGLADAVATTVIVSLRQETIDGANQLNAVQSAQLTQQLAQESGDTPLLYRKNGKAVGSLVLLWLGWVATVASTGVMIQFYRYVNRTGSAKSQVLVDREKLPSEDGSVVEK